jgi:hypothetical protein
LNGKPKRIFFHRLSSLLTNKTFELPLVMPLDLPSNEALDQRDKVESLLPTLPDALFHVVEGHLLFVTSSDLVLCVDELQVEGKLKITGKEFIGSYLTNTNLH